jgi:peptidoglycan/LPS O-acetylase OafA/YrhL
MEVKTGNRLEYLDSARGLAAIFVVWGHFIFQYGMQESFPIIAFSPLRFFYNAIPSVSFFFVLSGMVLSYKYFSKNLQVNYTEYVIARLFRIYPAFIVVLLLSFFLQYFFYHPVATVPTMAAGRDFWSEHIPLIKIIKEAVLFSDIKGSSTLVSQRWSLIVEIQISLLIPVMILITQKSKYWLLAFVACVMVIFHESFPAVYFLHFGLGILIALKNKDIAAKWTTLGTVQKILLFVTGAMLYNYRYMVPHFMETYVTGQSFKGIINHELIIKIAEGSGAALLIATLTGSLFFQKILHHKYLTFIGKISYSIYLCHFIILLAVTPLCIVILNNMGMSNNLMILFIAMIVTTGFVIGLSALLYYLVEKPFIQYGKRTAAIIVKRKTNRNEI